MVRSLILAIDTTFHGEEYAKILKFTVHIQSKASSCIAGSSFLMYCRFQLPHVLQVPASSCIAGSSFLMYCRMECMEGFRVMLPVS
jgi:hypothetical protein